jgi:hypothetical protein
MRLILCFMLAFGVFAILQGSAIAQSSAPVKVNKCLPIGPKTTVHYSGYTPAYYPSGPYYWRDPYGRRYYQYPAVSANTHTTNPTLDIDYVNVTHDPIAQIDFGLVAKGILVAEVRDVGTFSPGAEIKHNFGLNPNVFPLGTGLAQCVPLRATYKNGTTWENPHLPSPNTSIYH